MGQNSKWEVSVKSLPTGLKTISTEEEEERVYEPERMEDTKKLKPYKSTCPKLI